MILNTCSICGHVIWPWQRYGWIVVRGLDGRKTFDWFHRDCFRNR